MGLGDARGHGHRRDSALGAVLNQIRLSGRIVSIAITGDNGEGKESVTARLLFHQGNGTILLVCCGEWVATFKQFKPGDLAKVCGKIIVNSIGRAAILVTTIEHMDPSKQSAEEGEITTWNAGRKFQQAAKVTGDNRWATRAPFVK
jgi:hypothetical protein